MKSWKVTEAMLSQAFEFLLEPERFSPPDKVLDDYRDYLAGNELELAMLELEAVARCHGAKPGFWRRLQKAARQMNLQGKVAEYESEFRSALEQRRD